MEFAVNAVWLVGLVAVSFIGLIFTFVQRRRARSDLTKRNAEHWFMLASTGAGKTKRIVAPMSQASTPSYACQMHAAICQAVAVMNVSAEVARSDDLRQVHTRFRELLMSAPAQIQ